MYCPLTHLVRTRPHKQTGVDGIMGFAFQSLSSWTGPSVFDTLYETYNFYDGFSMCLRPQGGALTLGVDHSKDPNFKWTEISQEQWYNVEINDIKVGNQSIGLSWYDLNWNSVIVDSGTTLLILPSDIFAAVQKQFVALCSRGVNLPGVCNSPPKSQDLFQGACIPLTAQQVQLFPTFSINFPGIGDLPIQPIDYLVRLRPPLPPHAMCARNAQPHYPFLCDCSGRERACPTPIAWVCT